AYDHMVNEVKASHIMIALKEKSEPSDTLVAYRKISGIRQKLLEGADFEEVARAQSEDPSVNVNGGDLGWFSAFKMVYPFEKAAYETPVNELSPIVRSKFGYHILKPTAKRESRGEVEVAHIMLNRGSDDGTNDQERRINDIYSKLQQRESFDMLAKKYSEDSKTAKLGGVLRPFAAGSLNSTIFEEKAFGLENSGDISAPFQSEVGWHIVKLTAKHPIDPLENLRPSIERKIKSDSRSQLLESAVNTKLIDELNPWENQDIIQEIGSSFSIVDRQKDSTALLAARGDTIRVAQFAKFLIDDRWFAPVQKTDTVELKLGYERFKKTAMRDFYKSYLAETNEEYAQIIKEYREGILLFALMEEKIWNPAKEDSLGLIKFFDEHRSTYVNPKRFDVLVLNSTTLKAAKNARKLLQQGMSIQDIKDSLNQDGEVRVFFTKAVVTKDDALFPIGYKFKEGVSKIYKGSKEFTVVDLKNILPEKQKDLNDVRGQVIGDYQHHLEQEWLKALNESHEVNINEEVFESVKKELSR
ncbi:MAG: peptidylprolyl isomerase, partial [Leeuwenhoekiella sp.]